MSRDQLPEAPKPWLPCLDGWSPQTVSQKKPCLPHYAAFVRVFGLRNRKKEPRQALWFNLKRYTDKIIQPSWRPGCVGFHLYHVLELGEWIYGTEGDCSSIVRSGVKYSLVHSEWEVEFVLRTSVLPLTDRDGVAGISRLLFTSRIQNSLYDIILFYATWVPSLHIRVCVFYTH